MRVVAVLLLCAVARGQDSFRARTDAFWEWFAPRAPEFRKRIADGTAGTLAAPLERRISTLAPRIGWELAPGDHAGNEALVLSAPSHTTYQLLAHFWKASAPKIEGWEFHDWKRPADTVSFEVNGRGYATADFRASVKVDPKAERVDVEVFHPHFKALTERQRAVAAFLWLDAALGERAVETRVGELVLAAEPADRPLRGLEAMRSAFYRELKAYAWEADKPPTDRWLTYGKTPAAAAEYAPRADIVAGSTVHRGLIGDPAAAAAELKGTGARFAYVMFDNGRMTPGKQTLQRAELEDAIGAALAARRAGYVVGGAHGIRRAYIDLILFDEAAALPELRRLLAASALVPAARLLDFADPTRAITLKE